MASGIGLPSQISVPPHVLAAVHTRQPYVGALSDMSCAAPLQIIMTRKEGVFDGVELFRWDFGALFAIPIIVFGFNCHANVRAA